MTAAFLVVSWFDLVVRNGLGSAGATLRGLDAAAGFELDKGGLVPEANGLDPAVGFLVDFDPLTAGFCLSAAGFFLSGWGCGLTSAAFSFTIVLW